MVFDGSSSVWRCSMASAMDYDKRTRGRCKPASTMRGQEGGATRRRDKTMRGITTRVQEDERAAHQEATQQPAGMTRRREGNTERNKRTKRGDATTSWHDELTRGWRNERMARNDATTSWRYKTTRGRRNERMARGNATTSWHKKTTRGWCRPMR